MQRGCSKPWSLCRLSLCLSFSNRYNARPACQTQHSTQAPNGACPNMPNPRPRVARQTPCPQRNLVSLLVKVGGNSGFQLFFTSLRVVPNARSFCSSILEFKVLLYTAKIRFQVPSPTPPPAGSGSANFTLVLAKLH